MGMWKRLLVGLADGWLLAGCAGCWLPVGWLAAGRLAAGRLLARWACFAFGDYTPAARIPSKTRIKKKRKSKTTTTTTTKTIKFIKMLQKL